MRPAAPRLTVFLLATVLLGACAGDGGEPQDMVARIQAPPRPELPTNILDLTHAFGPDTIYWPTDTRGFELEVLAAGMTEKGYYYSANRFSAAEHGGTHLDAPVHFAEGHWSVDEIPVERLVGYGVVVDVTEKVSQDRDYQIAVADLELWEGLHGPIPEGAIVLLRTGMGRFYGDRERYLGTSKVGEEAIPELHFPGLHPDAAAWLRDQRKIQAVGIDTPSIDYGQSTLFGSHVTLFAGNIPAFENVADLDKVPDTGFLVFALPMKIAGGSGGPLRIIACW